MKVAFLDRDGTLIFEPKDGVVRPEDFRVLDGVIETLKKLQDEGYDLVMVSNQTFTDPYNEECFEKTQVMLKVELEKAGITFTEMFVCPHAEEDNCDCRKPKTGMVDEFLKTNDVDLSESFVVGDREMNDGGLAKNLGVRHIKMETNGIFSVTPLDSHSHF